MTGAGSALPAVFAPEIEYMGGLGESPTFYAPGVDIQVEELDLQHQLERMRQEDEALPIGSLEGNIEGAANVSFTLAGDSTHISNWLDLVFDDGNTIGTGLRPSARWFFGADLMDSTVNRPTLGTVVQSAEWSYQQGQPGIQVTLTMLYGDEDPDAATDFDPASVERPGKDEVYNFHGTELEIDGAAVETYLQSVSFSVNNVARLRRGADRHPVDAVTDSVEPDLTTNATVTDGGQKEIGYGGVKPVSMLDEVPASLSFLNKQGQEQAFSFDLKPDNYSWNDLVTADTDLNEDINWHVSGLEVA